MYLVRKKHGCCTVNPPGSSTAAELDSVVDGYINEGYRSVAVDLRKMTVISQRLVDVLVSASRKIFRRGGDLCVVIGDDVFGSHLLKADGAKGLIVRTTPEEAIAFLRQRAC